MLVRFPTTFIVVVVVDVDVADVSYVRHRMNRNGNQYNETSVCVCVHVVAAAASFRCYVLSCERACMCWLCMDGKRTFACVYLLWLRV